ncbi:MAG: cysteine rich repeat-containing protein [Syntrophorhabdales bacterium]
MEAKGDGKITRKVRETVFALLRFPPLPFALCLCFLLFSGTYAPCQDKRPCDDDIERFCYNFQVYGGWTAKCLELHFEELAPACRALTLDLVGTAEAVVGQACEEDVRSFCFGVRPGEGRIAKCLSDNLDRLSPVCKVTLYEAGFPGGS